MKLRQLFENWARTNGEKFHHQQWLLSKWDCQEGIVWPEEKFRLMVDGILKDLRLFPECAAADLGCGGGWILKELSRKHPQVIGVDFSPAMLDNARRTNPEQELLCADVTRLPFRSGTFDRILSYFVFINFVDDALVEKGIQEIVRILRPGGRALIGQLPDKEKSGLYDREKERYIRYCRKEFSLAEDLSQVCRIPLRLFNREDLEDILRPLNISYQFRDSFNPFYHPGEPERVSWRFDLLVEKKGNQ